MEHYAFMELDQASSIGLSVHGFLVSSKGSPKFPQIWESFNVTELSQSMEFFQHLLCMICQAVTRWFNLDTPPERRRLGQFR